ncbi:PASTA domain-containing protein [Paractinoplanes rishiriensis]|uniref:PASTA domain-containing protein n=1 Tax=Paractinoplanes rishiriensis TaxID=1050105 RepID=A0A919MV30_9ACTN|nr:PASTA domain-containing protein [Actinoplanes rishiriensis]GIE96398.1 hypothetical protein Ari01nite_38630 [Actinoplanes rishiriensis]
MSDERDETRRYPSAGRPDPTGPGDETRLDGPALDDRTQIAGSPVDDRTRVNRPDSTSVMPPSDDDWAPSRANPVWSGRAEVRSSQPGRSSYDTDWQVGPVPQQRDRWWMPIVVGIIVLILLAALGWGIYLIVQNSGGRPAPGPAPTVPVGTTGATPSVEATTPSAEPTTTSPSPAPSTPEPTTVATVPALRGLALADARAALDRTGLKTRLIYRDSDAPPNTVIDSDPTEGQEVPPDTTVTLVVARSATTGPTTTPTTTTPAGGAGGD